jgi:hypothetical protein
MIVESMTHAEVYKELERERVAVTTWWRHNLWNQRRRVLKSTRFPLSLWFDYTSARKNRYLFFTRIFNKKMKNILTGIAVPRMMKDGMYVYTSWLADHKLIFPMVLTPHMWKRYQDPDRGNVQKSGIELMKHYFIHNSHGKDTQNNRVMARSVRWNGEEHQACCVNDGVLLGQVVDGIYIVRTFITYEMTSGMQQEEFERCRAQILNDREMYDRAKECYNMW